MVHRRRGKQNPRPHDGAVTTKQKKKKCARYKRHQEILMIVFFMLRAQGSAFAPAAAQTFHASEISEGVEQYIERTSGAHTKLFAAVVVDVGGKYNAKCWKIYARFAREWEEDWQSKSPKVVEVGDA